MKKTIGNTPMIKINFKFKGIKQSTYVKLEHYNISGSIKDRVAAYMINNAIKRGDLKPGQTIIEATSGNTGIALAALGARLNHPVIIYMPNWASIERIKIMEGYGAQVILVTKEEGGFKACLEYAKAKEEEINGFLTNQFENKDNILANYETTGQEIVEQIPVIPSAFISGIGTGGTLMGVSAKLKEHFDIKTIALEPATMSLLKLGKIIRNHKIEGIGDDFIPAIVDATKIDDIIVVDDDDAINMSRKIASVLGIGVGISSGANLIAAALSELPNTVTVFADDNKKYLTTDLAKPIDENPSFVSNKVELIDYEIIDS